jgi:hypothetical protein
MARCAALVEAITIFLLFVQNKRCVSKKVVKHIKRNTIATIKNQLLLQLKWFCLNSIQLRRNIDNVRNRWNWRESPTHDRQRRTWWLKNTQLIKKGNISYN